MVTKTIGIESVEIVKHSATMWETYKVVTEFGPVQVVFTDIGHASVSVDAYVNDHNPTVQWRGRDLLPHTHHYAANDWSVNSDRSQSYVSYRDNWSDACQTAVKHAENVARSAVLAVLAEYPDAPRKSERNNATREMESIRKELSDLRRKRAELNEQLFAAERRLEKAIF